VTDDELTDLIARYMALRLSVLLQSNPRYAYVQPSQVRQWKEQLEEAKRELIANGLAIQD
jgi:hypothetical protein